MAGWKISTEGFLGIRYHDLRGNVVGNDTTGLFGQRRASALSFDKVCV